MRYPLCQSCGSPTRKHSARLCLACYKALPGRFPKEDRFWAKVDKNGPVPLHLPELGQCWEWTGWRGPYGYGELQSGPQRGQTREFAHRLSWEINVGPIPPDLRVLHRCDNPPCVRPDHLFLGTQIDNANDMWAKGRGVSRHKLTPQSVAEIRARAAAGDDFASLGREFGVHAATIKDAVTRRRWRNVA